MKQSVITAILVLELISVLLFMFFFLVLIFHFYIIVFFPYKEFYFVLNFLENNFYSYIVLVHI